MCGIAGFVDLAGQARGEELRHRARLMADSLRHRGPDDSGTWVDEATGVGFGFRRLAIIDLSEHGRQPMLSASGRYVVVFNGEIYNHQELREELSAKGHGFRGRSDTEVLVASFEEWGFHEALGHLNGMFAIAAWDRDERLLGLARDRLGEKPLYFGLCNGHFLFGSELKALRAHPSFAPDIDRDALASYLRHQYVPTPHSIYKGVHKLTPGTSVTVRPAAADDLAPRPYWSAFEAARSGVEDPFKEPEEETLLRLDSLLRDAVNRRMVADVPLGAFLSGGIDSSLVVALMQAQSRTRVRTFTIGFHEPSFNEAEAAKAVAGHLDTDHTELYVSPDQALDVIPGLPTQYDEPFADMSQIPTYLVAQLARRHVTVALSGDGGDELFGGYRRYFRGRRVWAAIAATPRSVRGPLARAITAVSPDRWERVLEGMGPFLPQHLRGRNPAQQLSKLASVLSVPDAGRLYLSLVSHWDDPSSIVLGGNEKATAFDDATTRGFADFVHRMMYLDSVSYLPDDILTKVDRATMATSLEGRAPLLDHRVFEFAWRVPLDQKTNGSGGKLILRRLLDRYVPSHLVDRPKMGFGVPMDGWLRGPLRAWAEDLLAEDRLRREGFFEPSEIRARWAEHLDGRRNWQYHLWDVLMFQAWLQETHPERS